MFLPSCFLPFTLLAVLTAAIPTETSIVVEDKLASPKPSVDTAVKSDAATSYQVDFATSESLISTSFSTITSTVQTTTTPGTLTKTLLSITSDTTVTPESSDLWIPDPASSTSSCTDKDKPKDKTNPPYPCHTCNPHTSSFHTKVQTHNEPAHSNRIVTPCSTPYKFPVATTNTDRIDIASNSPVACIIPLLNRLLRRCYPVEPVPGPEPHPSIGLCIAPPVIDGTGYVTSTAKTISTSKSSTPDFQTMVVTSITDGVTILSTVVASATSSVSQDVQVPVETFNTVPQEEVTGDGEGKKEPACGTGRGGKACPPEDRDM